MTEKTLLRSVGANVRFSRDELGRTQVEVANLAEVDVRYLQKIEAGEANPSIGVLFRVARGLSLEVTDLLAPARLRKRRPGRPRPR